MRKAKIALLTALALGLFGWMHLAGNSKNILPLTTHLPKDETVMQSAMQQQSFKRQAGLKALVSKALHAAQQDADRNDKIRDVVRQSFHRLLEESDFLDKEVSEATVFSQLAEDSSIQDEIVSVLATRGFANTYYGEDQAVVRHYGIKYLNHLAENGDRGPLNSALTLLSHELIEGKSWMNGQWVDLEDLLRSEIVLLSLDDRFDLKDFLLSSGLLPVESNLDPKSQYLETLMHGIYDGLRKKMSHAKAEALLLKTIPSLAAE